MFKKRFGLIALILCVFLTIGYFAVNTGAVSTVLLAIQGAITDGNLVKFSGINGVGVDAGISAINVVKCKFDAAVSPTVDNDIDEGYTVGSGWYDITNDKSYVCLDNTDGAASWLETGVTPSTAVTKTGDFTAGRLPEIDNSTGILKQSDIEKKPSGGYDVNANSIGFTEQVLTSGTSITWDLRLSNKATLTLAHNFTITITSPTEALNAQLIITQDGTGSRVMDEIVTQTDTAIATTDVHADTEIIDLVIDIPTGARIRFKTSAADLPDPLVVDTVYWAIRTSENHIKVSTTKANAIAGTAIDITDQGSGTHTVQQLVKWTGGTLGVLSTAAGSEDILSLTYKTGDKQWYAQLGKDFY